MRWAEAIKVDTANAAIRTERSFMDMCVDCLYTAKITKKQVLAKLMSEELTPFAAGFQKYFAGSEIFSTFAGHYELATYHRRF